MALIGVLRMVRRVVKRRTVRGDGIGEAPGRRTVGWRGVCEDTELGEPYEEGDAGGDAYRGVRNSPWDWGGSRRLVSMGLVLGDLLSSD